MCKALHRRPPSRRIKKTGGGGEEEKKTPNPLDFNKSLALPLRM